MSKKPIETPQAHDLRRTFEDAIAQIQRCGEPRGHSKTPIAVHRQTTEPGDPAAEKRALSDAARALARLWNISPALVRRGG